MLQERDIFYWKPKTRFEESDEVWYCNSPVGHNILSRKLKDLFIEAGLSFDHVQNHSLRATGINRLYSRGIPEKAIMERSGHHSVGRVRSYEHSTDMQKKEISSVLISNRVLRVTNSENQEVVCQGIKKKLQKAKKMWRKPFHSMSCKGVLLTSHSTIIKICDSNLGAQVFIPVIETILGILFCSDKII